MARSYINRFGRFGCVDPLLGQPGDPQSWNRYAYVRNNPTNNVDPSGKGIISFLVNFFKVLFSGVIGGLPGNVPIAGTPPIFSDPLGDTQATLNSIYNPASLSQFGISDFLPGAHDQLFAGALGPCNNVSGIEIAKVQKASRDLDRRTQDPKFSYIHSMLNGTQTYDNGHIGQYPEQAIAWRNDFILQRLSAAQAAWSAGRTDEALTDFGEAMHPVTDSLSPSHMANGVPLPWCGDGGCGTPIEVLSHVYGERLGYLNKHPEIQQAANGLIRNAWEAMTGQALDCEY